MKHPRAVAPDTVISLEVVMHDAQGELIHSSDQPLEYLHGGYGGVFEGIERAVEGKRVGDTVRVQLEPEDAFGEYDAELLRVEPRGRFPETVEVGMQFEGVPGENEEEARIYTITDITGDQVVVDANHPLAGERLWFKCVVKEVRGATPEEMQHGHVHGAHGVHTH